MSVHPSCVEVVAEDRLEDVETETAIGRWRGGGGCFWVLLDADTPADVTRWLRARDIACHGLETFLEAGHEARFQLLNDLPVFRLPTLVKERPGAPVITTFVCFDRLLIQIHNRPAGPPGIDPRTATSQRPELAEASTSGLVCGLLVLHSATLLAVAVGVRAEARRLSARMDEEADGVALREIVGLKRRIRDLDEAADEQLALFSVLKIVRRPGLDLVRVADFFQVAIANSESCDRAVDRLTRQAEDLESGFNAFQQGKLNRRLGLLTIVSAIFLPLTLLAGIYGMNFDVMPELHLGLGYPALLVLMALSAGALVWYFWSRGWFKDL